MNGNVEDEEKRDGVKGNCPFAGRKPQCPNIVIVMADVRICACIDSTPHSPRYIRTASIRVQMLNIAFYCVSLPLSFIQ